MTGADRRQPAWLTALNACPQAEAVAELVTVCSSPRWAQQVAAARPYPDADQLLAAADERWCALGPQDWLQALRGHPAIGEQGGSSQEHSRHEQSGLAGSSPQLLAQLAAGNRAYEERFGHVFLVAAAGRSGGQILAELTRRLDNPADAELREAAEEHRRITRLRLERLLAAPPSLQLTGDAGSPAPRRAS